MLRAEPAAARPAEVADADTRRSRMRRRILARNPQDDPHQPVGAPAPPFTVRPPSLHGIPREELGPLRRKPNAAHEPACGRGPERDRVAPGDRLDRRCRRGLHPLGPSRPRVHEAFGRRGDGAGERERDEDGSHAAALGTLDHRDGVPDLRSPVRRTTPRGRRAPHLRAPARLPAGGQRGRVPQGHRALRRAARDPRPPLRRLLEPAQDPRLRLHPRERVRGDRDHPAARPRPDPDKHRPLDRPRPQPGRPSPRRAAERARRRPQPQLRLGVDEHRAAVGSRVLGAAAAGRSARRGSPGS